MLAVVKRSINILKTGNALRHRASKTRETRRIMSSETGSEHIQKTSDSRDEQKKLCDATITEIQDLSPTVKGLNLRVHKEEMAFKPGQWLDMIIPNIEVVTGYSMSSGPKLLTTEQQLQLAVKYSSHPPTHWVHTQCKAGDMVKIQIGGDFFYPPSVVPSQHSLLLVAGGVGINPLMSMIHYVVDARAGSSSSSSNPEKVHLLYSAKSFEEAIYREEIQQMCKDQPNFLKCHFFLTGQDNPASSTPANANITYARIDKTSLQSALSHCGDISRTLCFVCGPSLMIDSVTDTLLNLRLAKEQIFYEKWW